jgi:hypothetical protein
MEKSNKSVGDAVVDSVVVAAGCEVKDPKENAAWDGIAGGVEYGYEEGGWWAVPYDESREEVDAAGSGAGAFVSLIADFPPENSIRFLLK